jgi:hypothetical protein
MLTENGVRRLVARICTDLDPTTPPPSVVFAYRKQDVWKAVYEPSTNVIRMPNQRWIKEHKVATDLGYRLIVLHEVAHHLFGAYHNDHFYYGLFGLCDLYDVRLSFAFADEYEYKPRAASRGFDRYIKSMQNRIDELGGKP